MTDLFASPKSMLGRAQKHIAELESQINAFMRDQPWSKVVELEAGGRANIHKIKFTQTLRDDLPNVAFDAANNLRAVLDQIGFAIANARAAITKAKTE